MHLTATILSVEETCFDHLDFGFVTKKGLLQRIECHGTMKMT